MIEEPPLQQSRSRIRDPKVSLPSKSSNNKNGSKLRQSISSESNLSSSNSIDLDFIEKTDLEKLTLLLNSIKKRSNDDEHINSNINCKDKIKKIIHKFIKMRDFPVNKPQLITKLLQILQLIFHSISDTIFSEDNSSKNKEDQQDVKMVVGIQCPICEKLFRSSYYVDKHILSKHPQHSFFWQNLKIPYPYYDIQKTTNPNEEIEKALKQIHKDLRKRRRNSSVSIESRISNVEATMQNLGIIKENYSSRTKQEDMIHHSRRHSSNSINVTSLHTDDVKHRKSGKARNDSDYDSYYDDDQSSKNHGHRRHLNPRTNDSEVSDDQAPKSASVQPFPKVQQQPQLAVHVPSSTRVEEHKSGPQPSPQPSSQSKPQNVKLHSSSSVPSTPSKIPKLPSKPFIPNLQLQTLKSQGQIPIQPQLQMTLQPQKPSPPASRNASPAPKNSDDDNENEMSACFTPEPRRKPQSSRATPMRRPIPRKKPASLNVQSLEIDTENKTVVNKFQSPRLPSQELEDLNFAGSYQASLSARATVHPGPEQGKANSVTPHVKRSLPIPSPKKAPEAKAMTSTPAAAASPKVFAAAPKTPQKSSPQMGPFSMIQIHSDNEDDDDEDEEVHIETANDNETVGVDDDEVEVTVVKKIEPKVEKNDQKVDKIRPIEKVEGVKNQAQANSPVSIGISKHTHVDDEDDVPVEYFDSVSSISSESSEQLPEIDFRPKPKNIGNSKGPSESRRKRRKKDDPNNNS